MSPSKKISLALAATALAGLAWFSVQTVQKNKAADQSRLCLQQLTQIGDALQQYKLHNYHYPTVEQGLQALLTAPADARAWRGPYIENLRTTDPWAQEIQYKTTEYYGFVLSSAGPDGEMGTADDVTYHN